MSYSETVLPPIVPMAGMAYKASVGTDQLPAPGNVPLLIGRGQRATHGRRLGMKDKMKKASAAVGTPLIMAGVLVAAMHVAVNAHAIQEYCSKAVFKGLEIVIASQTEGETH